jgi:hypothetical protein
MIRRTRSLCSLVLALAGGATAVLILLLLGPPVVLSGSVPAPSPLEQAPGTVALWLAPPETPRSPGPWALTVEAHHAAWEARRVAVEQRLAALQGSGQMGAYVPLDGDVGFRVSAWGEVWSTFEGWPEVARVTAVEEAAPEALAAWWRRGLPEAAAEPRMQQAAALTLSVGRDSYVVSGQAPSVEWVQLTLILDGGPVGTASAPPWPDGSGGYRYQSSFPSYYVTPKESLSCRENLPAGSVVVAVQAGRTVAVTIPPLTALADPATGMVSGQASPSATLRVYLYRHDGTGIAAEQVVTATASGAYQASLNTLSPGDYGYVFQADAAGNSAHVRFNVPWLQGGVGQQRVGGLVAPNRPVTATLRDAGGALLDTYTICGRSDGTFSAVFRDVLQPGYAVAVAAGGQEVSMTVPILTADPDPAQDTVSGLSAAAGSTVTIDLYDGPVSSLDDYGPPRGTPAHTVTATVSGGAYAAALSGIMDLAPPNYGAVYVTDTAGHQAYRRFALPFLQVPVGGSQLMGQVGGSQQVTLTIWAASGVPRTMYSFYSSSGRFSKWWNQELYILPGDWVTLTLANGEETGIAIPVLTARADRADNAVYGTAPPGGRIRVEIEREDMWPRPTPVPALPGVASAAEGTTVWTTSSAAGTYTASFGSAVTIEPRDYGTAAWLSEAGHEAYVTWGVLGKLTLSVQRGSNVIEGTYDGDLNWESPPRVDITVRDAAEQIKWQSWIQMNHSGRLDTRLYGDNGPISVETGDTIEAVAGGRTLSLTVPELTVEVDVEHDALSGQAPPGAPLQVSWSGADPWDGPARSWTITTAAGGTYALDLSGQVDVERGDRAEVAWTDAEGNTVWAVGSVPRLEAVLGQAGGTVRGVMHPGVAVTATLYDLGGGVLDRANTRAREDGLVSLPLATPFAAGQRLVVEVPEDTLSLDLPDLAARIDAEAGVIEGTVPPGASLRVAPWTSYDWSRGGWLGWLPVTATVTGTFRADLGGQFDDTAGASATVVYLDPDGHRVLLLCAVPHLEVTLGSATVEGWAAGSGAVTVTLQAGDGTVRGWGTVSVLHPDSRFQLLLQDDAGRAVTVQRGDRLLVESVGTVFAMEVPALDASYDRASDVLSGHGPPGAWLRAILELKPREVLVGPDGHYALDWSDQEIPGGAWGAIEVTDEAGNETRLLFAVPRERRYLPFVGKG